MKVRILTQRPKSDYAPGQVVDLPEEEAREWLDRNDAEPVILDKPKPPAK